MGKQNRRLAVYFGFVFAEQYFLLFHFPPTIVIHVNESRRFRRVAMSREATLTLEVCQLACRGQPSRPTQGAMLILMDSSKVPRR